VRKCPHLPASTGRRCQSMERKNVYYNNHLLTDYRTTLQFVETPDHIAQAEAEAALDQLYADVLPLEPIVCMADHFRIDHVGDRYTLN